MMGIREDREKFNMTGLRGLLRKIMAEKDEAYIRILSAGWQGEEAESKPSPGSGRYIYYKKGYGVYEYSNAYVGDTCKKVFKVEI